MMVYVAAPYVDKVQARDARRQLREAGIDVNSRWLDFDAHGMPITDDILRLDAAHDVEDILNADAIVVLNTHLSEGKAWEQGFAYGLGMPIIAIGRPEHCVFHHLDVYQWVPDVAHAIAAVKAL